MKTLADIRASFLDYFDSKDHHVIPSSALVPHNDPTLMFTNAGMVQFKNVFSGAETLRDSAGNRMSTATSTQKCIRAGGKHNDLDNVGYTARHHTFFEMLGNFSFGDYFKEGAIVHAWELITKVYGLPEDKIFLTVYHTDDEAFDIWKKVSGFPDEKILRVPTKDNFWAMGPTGPCGPCSEIFYDHGGDAAEGKWALDADGNDLFGDRFIEIWNLVFMQYEQLEPEEEGGKRIDLPAPCIDTGMGLERVAAVMQGVHNNYDIDLFKTLINASEELTKNNDPDMIASHRVLADHLRSCSFLLAEGVRPSNEGRGYVLRRIMRRGMRHAHLLGANDPLMYKLVPSLVEKMGDAFPELQEQQSVISDQLKAEEIRFKETLERGLKLLDGETESLKAGDSLKGEVAFKLYDTYGFPLDLTQDILRGKDMEVEQAGFDAAMAEQKERARAAWSGAGGEATDAVWFELAETLGATEFLGYQNTSGTGEVTAILKDGNQTDTATKGDAVMILTNQTPFYGESGGQAGDTGEITTRDGLKVKVTDTKKQLGKLHVHMVEVLEGELKKGDAVQLTVDEDRRNGLKAHHSATHILHAALQNNLGDHVTQKGSLVEAGYLRFDFSHDSAVTKEQLATIEAEVNAVVAQNADVVTQVMTPDEAKAAGAMALFGEKYGDEVRVLSMGDADGKSYSMELCGGTHAENTGDIGEFGIVKESSVASGVRRIEARVGAALEAYKAEQQAAKVEEAKRKKEAEAAKAELASQVGDVRESFLSEIDSAETVGNVTFYGRHLEGVPGKELRGLVDEFKKRAGSGVVTIVASADGKASIVVGVTDDLTDSISAVDLVRKGSEALGGKGGGGRPDFAQAGGPDAANADAAIGAIKDAVA